MNRSSRLRTHRFGPRIEGLEGRELLSAVPGAAPTPRAMRAAEMRRVHAPTPTSGRWSWLADTYWYVPTANLPALIYGPTNGTLVPVQDQTVYHISGYRSGYFWGETVTQLGTGSPLSSSLVGSVTPQGRVLLSFTSTSGTMTQGYGTMTRKAGQWTMENQMFTAPSGSLQIGHWAYMVQTRPGLKSWSSLPYVGVSVPTFLGNYSGSRPGL